MKLSALVSSKSKSKVNQQMSESQNCSSHLRDSMRFNDVNKWILSIENKQKNKPIWSIESSLEERQKSLINWLWDFDNHLNLTLSQSINNLSIIKSVFQFKISNQKSKSNRTFQSNDCLFRINQIQIHTTHIWLVVKSIMSWWIVTVD